MIGPTFNNYYQDMPWQRPFMPVFTPQFDGWGGCGFNLGGFSGTSSNSSSSSNVSIHDMSEEEYRKYKDKQLRERSKVVTQAKKEENINTQQLKEIQGKISKLEKGKQSDGSVKFIEDFDKVSTGKKLMMAGMNMLDGVGNVCKSLVGFDKDGKWSLGKCVRNIAIAAAVGALCVYAAPLGAIVATKLGGGAAALAIGKTIAATKVILPTIGVVSGTIMTGAGVYNTCKADTLEEFNNATQQIGQGMFIGLSSAAGLRGISKTAGVAARGSGMWSNLGAALKNTFINPWKATTLEFNAAQSAISLATSSAAANGTKIGFLKKLSVGKAGVKDAHYKINNRNFRKVYNKKYKDIESKIINIESEITRATDIKQKALLEFQRDSLYNRLSQLDTAKTRADWINIRKANASKDIGYKWYHKRFLRNKEFDINGQKITAKVLKPIMKEQKALTSSLKELTGLRLKQASQFVNENSNTASDFNLSTKWYAAPWNWCMTKLGIGLTGGDLMDATMIFGTPWYLLQPIVRNSCFQPINVMTAINPIYNPVEPETLSAEEYTAQYNELSSQLEELKAKQEELKAILGKA